jgi:hypothetical protein
MPMTPQQVQATIIAREVAEITPMIDGALSNATSLDVTVYVESEVAMETMSELVRIYGEAGWMVSFSWYSVTSGSGAVTQITEIRLQPSQMKEPKE